jgi:hypothetical protein
MPLNSTANTGKEKRVLFTRCCDGVATSEELHDMYAKEREVSVRTFAKHVDLRTVAESLGYAYGRHASGLRISKDWAVRFYKSVFRGEPCYYMDWSCIDHVYLHQDQIARLKSA